MTPPPRLPDPGTPAYTATADQFAAAQRDAQRQAAALLRAGARLVATTGLWAAGLLDSVRPGMPYREVCTHLAQTSGPAVRYVTEPALLLCRACQVQMAARTPGVCAMCGRADPFVLPHRPHIAQQGVTLVYGVLCLSCSAQEHPPRRIA